MGLDAFPSKEELEYSLGPVLVPEPLALATAKEDMLMSSLWGLQVPAGAQGISTLDSVSHLLSENLVL